MVNLSAVSFSASFSVPSPTLAVISTLPSPASLQVGASAYSLYNGTRLTPNGCSRDGSKNCSAACQDMAQVFSSIDTFQNCLAFPTINRILSTVNTTEDYKALAHSYGITGEDTNSSSNVVGQITQCLASYCSSNSKCTAFSTTPPTIGSCTHLFNSKHFPITLAYDVYSNDLNEIVSTHCDANSTGHVDLTGEVYCGANLTIDAIETSSIGIDVLHGTLGCIAAICDSVKRAATVNTEIGGIGIYVSYFMQAGIALIAWTLLVFWTSGLYSLSFFVNLRLHGPEGAVKVAQQTQHKYKKHKETVIEGLIEFHKAQCFFMLAIQVAALAAKHGSFLGRSSLQQIHNDYAFIDVLATGGYLPITFVLYSLRMAGYKSGYMLLLSACTIAVSAAALLSRESTLLPDTTGPAYPDCGNVNPVAFCLGTDFDFDDFGNFEDYILPASFDDLSFDYYQGTPSFSLSVFPLIYSLVVFLLLVSDYGNLQNSTRLRKLWIHMTQEEWPSRKWIGVEAFLTGFGRFARSLETIGSNLVQSYQAKESPALRRRREQLARMEWPQTKRITQSSLSLARSLWCFGFGSPRKLCDLILALVNLTIVWLFIYFMAIYMDALTIFKSSNSGYVDADKGIPIDLSNWTFGQLVAITVWAPPLIQYAYLELYGMQGQRWHLPKGYEVVSAKTEENATNEPSSSSNNQLLPSSNRRSHALSMMIKEGDENGTPMIAHDTKDEGQHDEGLENHLQHKRTVSRKPLAI